MPSDEQSRVLQRSPDDLCKLLHSLQTAPEGNGTLDALIEAILVPPAAGVTVEPAVRWSEDLMALLRLVPSDNNFSLGERDGVLWAWIQPNDDWTPADHEMRHDHPRGSGLIVACTLPLAMAAALVALRAFPNRQADAAPQDQLADAAKSPLDRRDPLRLLSDRTATSPRPPAQ